MIAINQETLSPDFRYCHSIGQCWRGVQGDGPHASPPLSHWLENPRKLDGSSVNGINIIIIF